MQGAVTEKRSNNTNQHLLFLRSELLQNSLSFKDNEPDHILRIKMLDTTSSQFDSFLFWRQPIPSLDLSELEELGISIPKSKEQKSTKSSLNPPAYEEEDLELLKFSTFNFWKEPIASVETLDFNLLL